jgi:hypothetical protein
VGRREALNSVLIFAIGCLIQFLLLALLDRLLPGPTPIYTNFVLGEGVLTIPVASFNFDFKVGDQIDLAGSRRTVSFVGDNTIAFTGEINCTHR